MARFRPLRLLPALVALSFVLTAAAPAVAHACAMSADATCCCGHGEGAVCPMDAAPAPADVPTDAEACCEAHPAGPLAERALVPPALALDAPALPVLWTLAPSPPAPPSAARVAFDTGPPPVRPHLAFAVLLI